MQINDKHALTFIKYLTIMVISIALGYAWAAHCYLPKIELLTETIRHLDPIFVTEISVL